MAKDGTNRGGRRVRAGAKPDPLNEKLAAGRPATRLEDPLNEPFDFEGGDIGAGLSQTAADFAAMESQLAGALGAAGPSWAPSGSMGTGILVGKLTAPPSVVGLLPAAESPVRLASAVSPLSPELSRAPIALPPLGASPAASSGDRRRTGRDYDDIELGKELLGTVMQRPPSAG